MQVKNTAQRYGFIAILLHWFMAILIIVLIGMGLWMTNLPISLQKLKWYGWHKEWGIVVLIFVMFRLYWRFINTRPLLPHTLPLWERISAILVHWLFYFFMFVMPISGWLLSSSAGLQVSFFDWFLLPNLITEDENNRALFTFIHTYLAYLLIAFICLHVAAALKHHFINKDDILKRIL